MKDKLLTVIIPCYNEKNHIEDIVNMVRSSYSGNMEIIIVDDCSTDGTRDILETKIKPVAANIIYHEKNMGKGASLRTGVKFATGDVVIVQDADMEYNPSEYHSLVQPIFEEQADVVYGSRFSGGNNMSGYWHNYIANRVLTFLSNLFTGLKITDMETCYKAIKRELLQSIDIEENRFGFEPEITAKLAKMKCRIMEVPISYKPRTKEEGKKIGIKDGIRALYCIVRYR